MLQIDPWKPPRGRTNKCYTEIALKCKGAWRRADNLCKCWRKVAFWKLAKQPKEISLSLVKATERAGYGYFALKQAVGLLAQSISQSILVAFFFWSSFKFVLIFSSSACFSFFSSDGSVRYIFLISNRQDLFCKNKKFICISSIQALPQKNAKGTDGRASDGQRKIITYLLWSVWRNVRSLWLTA